MQCRCHGIPTKQSEFELGLLNRFRLCLVRRSVLSKHPADMKKAQESLLSEIHPINDRWGNVEYKNTVAVNLLNKLSKEVLL